MPQPNKEALRATRKYSPGRPKIYDHEKIIEQMYKWVKNENSIAFTDFCYEHKYLPGLIWRLQQQYDDFEEAYTFVKMKLAERRERLMNGNLINYGAWNRYQKMYDPFLEKAEEDDKDRDAARRKDIAECEQTNLVMLAQMAAEGKIKQE